jgi:hypothetical protein
VPPPGPKTPTEASLGCIKPSRQPKNASAIANGMADADPMFLMSILGASRNMAESEKSPESRVPRKLSLIAASFPFVLESSHIGKRLIGKRVLAWPRGPAIGAKLINGGMKWPFVIGGHKPSMGRPSPFRERGLGVRAKLLVNRTLKSPNCDDCARCTIRRANAVPSPQPSPRGRGWSTPVLSAQFRRLTPRGPALHAIVPRCDCRLLSSV